MSQIVLASTRQCLVLSQALPQTAELLASLCVYARVLLAAFIRPAVELIVQCLRQAVLGSDQPAQASPSAEPGKERDFQYGFSQILRRQGRTSGSVSGYELAGKKTCFHEDSQMSEGMVRCVPGGRRGPGERAIPTVLADRSGVLPDRFADSDFGQRSVYESCGTCSGVLTFDLVQSGEVSDCVTVAPRLSPVSSETNWRSGEGEYRGFTLFDGPSSIFSSSQRPGTAVERPLRGAVSSEELDSSASDDASLLEEFAGDPSSAVSGDGALEHLSEVPAAGRRLASPNGVRKKGCSPSLLPKRRERQANCNPADEDRRGFRCSNHSRTSVDHGYVQALLETLEKFSLVADQALLQETFEAVLPLLTVVIVTPLSDGECVAAVSLLVALLRRTGNCSLPTERLRVLLRCFLAHLQPVLRQEDQGLRLEVMRAVGTLGAIGLETYWALGICGGTEAVTVRRRYSQSIIGLYPVGDRVDLGARGPLTSTKDTSFPAARRDEISAVVHTERAVPGTCGAGADCFLDSMTPVVSSQQTVGKRGTRPSAGVADAAGDLIGQNGASWLSLRCVGVLLSVIRAPTLSHAHLLAFLSIARILRDSGTSAAFRSAGDLFNKARIIRQFKGDARLEPAAATPEPVPTRDGESGICISRSTALTKILPQFLRTAVSMLRSSVSCFDRRYSILSALMSLSSMVKEAPSSEALLLLEALSDAVDRCVADLRRESSHSPHTRLFEGQSVHPLVAPAAAGCADQGRELPGCPKPRYSHMCPKATCRGGQDAMGQPPPHGCLEDLSKTSIGGPGLRGDNSPQPQDSSPPFPAPIRGWTAAAVAAVTSRRSAPETKAVCGSLTKKAFVRRWDLCAEGAGVSPEQQLSTDGPKAGAQGSRTNCLWPENAVNLSENEGNESRRTGTADSPWWPPGKRSTAEKELWVILPLLEILLSKLPERISDYSRRTAQQIHELLYSRRCCADTSLAERALLTLRRCGTLLRPTVGPQLHVLTQLCTAPCVSYGAGTFSSGMTGCHKWPSSPCDSQLDRCQKIESPSLDCGCCCCSPAPLSLRLAVVKTIRTLLTCCGFPLLIGAIVRRLMDILRCSGEDRAPIELRQSLLETVGTMQQQFPAEAGPYGRLLSRIILSTGPAGEPSASSQSATTEQKNGQPFPAYDANCRVQNAGQECDSASLKEGGSSSSGGAHVSARLQVKPKGAYTVGHHIEEPSAEHSPKTTSSPRRRWACPQDAAVEAKEGVRFCGCGTAQLPHNLVSATANDCPSGVERCEEGVAFREGEPQQKQAADEDVEGCALLQDKRSTSKREGQSRQSDQQGCVSEEWNKQGEIRDEKRGTARRRRSSVRARARGRGGPRPGRPQTAAELWKNCDFNTKTELRCWFRSISVAMLKECRAPALRACLPVALHEPSVAAALAPAAFLTYWAACCSKGQLQLMHIVGRAFRRVLLSSHISLSSLHQILNFVELTERQRWPLPVDTQLLAAVAEKCQAYAKAVRYREELWLADPGGSVEALIRLNNELHRVEVARGVLVHAQKNLRLPVKECWYVQLNEWEQALEAYEQREREDPNNVEWLKGKMRCLGALGEWERLALVADDLWRDIDTEVPESPSCFEHSSPQSGTFGGPYRSLEETAQTPTSQDRSRACSSSMPFSRLGGSQEAVNNEAAGKRSSSQRGQGVGLPRPQKLQRAGSSQSHLAEKRRETASLAASAAFHFRDWKGLQRCVQWFPSADSYERAFYTAVLCIQRGDFPAALERIQRARQLLDPELTVLLAESYERAYPALVSLQQLAELEEIVEAHELRRKRHEEQQKSEGTWRSAVESDSLRTQQFFRHEEEDDEEQEAVLDTLQRLWRTRLATCEARADTWQEILRVRSLILPPHEDAATWLRFSSLCRRQHRARLSLEILRSLRGHHHTRGDVRVALEAFKVLHSVGRRLEAQLLLSSFCCGFVTAFFNGQPEQLLCPQGSDVPICVGAASLLEYRAVTPWTQHGNPMCSSQGASFHARPVDPGASAVIIPDSVSLERKFFERIRETPLSRDGSRGFEHSVLRLRQQLMKIVHPVRCLPRQIVLVMLLDEMGDRDVAGCLRGSLGSALEGVRSVWRSGELASEGVQNLGHSVSGGCPTPSLSADLGDTLRDGRRVADRKGGSYEDASWRLCLDMCSPDLHGGLRQWNVGSATGVTKDEVLRLLSTSHLKLAQWTKDIYNSGRGGPFLLHDVNSCCVTGTRNLRGAVGGDNSGRRANHGLLTPPLRLSTPSDTTAGVLAEESWASDVDAVFQILHWQRRAVLLQFSSAKAWSAWAITNFQVVETLKRSTHSPQSVPDSTRLFPLECRKPGLDHDCGLGPCAVTLGTPSSHLPSGSCAANSSPSARSSETECLVRHYSSRDGSYGRLRVYPASTAVNCSGLSLEWRHAEFDNGLLWEAPYADSAMLLNQPPLLPEALRNPHSACSNPSQGCRGPDIGSSCSREASCQAPSCRKPADLCAVRERSTGVEPALTSDVDAPDRPGGRPRNVPRSDEETDCGKPSKQAVLRSLLPHFVVEAVRGFLRSIELCPIRSQQDVLRLLKLWFEHTDIPVVSSLVQQGVYTVPLATWLDVLPQLLGRLSSANSCLRSSLVHLLGKAARSFPQELIFPVAVASKSTNALLSSCACTLLHIIASQRRELVQQAMLVSQELVRASALWEERWLRCLEQASEAYHTAQDCQKVVEILEPMHAEISRGPQTFSETLFLQKYGRELESARVYLRRYHRSGNRHDIDQCWMFYLRVFSRLLRDTQNLRHLDLREVSASLAEMKDLQLAVPGTAGAGRDYPLIQSFQTEVLVLTSKQRPRKMGIVGSDGREWPFLLKGQDDLTQDERIMQALRLINHLMERNVDARRKELSIPVYSIVPLSPCAGLIGWVRNTETLFSLIKAFRQQDGIPVNHEQVVLKSLYHKYEALTLLQKVNLFEQTAAATSGQALRRVLWLQSRGSEDWLVRRANFCKSVAVMSMVGYILGLGDRHPSNLLLMRDSGRVAHIDFSDCFEVAAHRKKFPERVPFRLTRMIVGALESGGVEGAFRATCEQVMALLRYNRDAIIAMLEASFLHESPTARKLHQVFGPQHASAACCRTPGDTKRNVHSKLGFRRGARSSDVQPPDLSPGFTPRSRGVSQDCCSRLSAESSATSVLRSHRVGCAGGSKSSEGWGSNERTISRSARASRSEHGTLQGSGDGPAQDLGSINAEDITCCARWAIARVASKLAGRDFEDYLDIPTQVDRLIDEAVSVENLCVAFVGWCPFW
ncbi:target of rapamycin [Cystoisospora suis]|uniref:non-specific serine/threonine protein kinase n=1 Tax=Cystoisospora suis TaxID=483139 RepID=A0A2C6LBU5_9APIC|nr:target of rapamycin [Cystoisospora suis]